MSLKLPNLKKISYFFAKALADKKKESHQQKYIYFYSLQIVLGTLLEIIAIILISWIFGFLIQAIVCLIVFVSIRLYSQGFHADTYAGCFTITVSLILGIPLLAIYFIGNISLILSILIFILSIIITYIYAPSDHIEKPIVSEIYRKELKIKALILNLIWFLIYIALFLINKYSYLTSIIVLATLTEAITILPFVNTKTSSYNINCAKTAH